MNKNNKMNGKTISRLKKSATPYDEKLHKFKSGIYKTHNEVLFRIIDNHLMTGIVILDDNSEDVVNPGIYKTKVPIIPNNIIEQIVRFFRYVYVRHHNAESIILLWYNPEIKAWEIEVPEQVVSSASLDYTRDDDYTDKMMAKGFKLIGTIHSHGEMNAFHSGTDDHDEFGFDGLHITIGHVMSKPEFACRYIMKDWYKTMEPNEVLIYLPQEDDVPVDWTSKVNKRKSAPTAVGKLFGDPDYDNEEETKDWKRIYWDNDQLV